MLVASVVVSVPCRTRHVARVSRARAKVSRSFSKADPFQSFSIRYPSESLLRYFEIRLKRRKRKKILGVFPAIAVNNQGR